MLSVCGIKVHIQRTDLIYFILLYILNTVIYVCVTIVTRVVTIVTVCVRPPWAAVPNFGDDMYINTGTKSKKHQY